MKNKQLNIKDRLMELFCGCGYTQYKMNKFEEYELYAQNRSFLPSRSIITFTDTDGRLMALKPDVTLSIVKNSRDGKEYKLYYNESVYRTDRNTHTFAEITQTGLEYIGNTDTARLCEVLTVAMMSLDLISNDNVTDISHLGLLSSLLDSLGINEKERASLLTFIENKSVHEAAALCSAAGVPEKGRELLIKLMTLDPSPDKACGILSSLDGNKTRVDFSVLSDTNYYNGIVFRGYVRGVPSAVLSGGQYDMLMRRMGKSSSAVGFAVYLDRLDGLFGEQSEPCYDRLILYGENTDAKELCRAVRQAVNDGKTYTAEKTRGEIKYKELCDLR